MEKKYKNREFVSTRDLNKSLDAYIDKVVSGNIEKLAIVRNGKSEVVMLPINEYERIKDISDFIEALEIAKIIKERVTDDVKFISKEELYESLEKTRKAIVDDLQG